MNRYDGEALNTAQYFLYAVFYLLNQTKVKFTHNREMYFITKRLRLGGYVGKSPICIPFVTAQLVTDFMKDFSDYEYRIRKLTIKHLSEKGYNQIAIQKLCRENWKLILEIVRAITRNVIDYQIETNSMPSLALLAKNRLIRNFGLRYFKYITQTGWSTGYQNYCMSLNGKFETKLTHLPMWNW